MQIVMLTVSVSNLTVMTTFYPLLMAKQCAHSWCSHCWCYYLKRLQHKLSIKLRVISSSLNIPVAFLSRLRIASFGQIFDFYVLWDMYYSGPRPSYSRVQRAGPDQTRTTACMFYLEDSRLSAFVKTSYFQTIKEAKSVCPGHSLVYCRIPISCALKLPGVHSVGRTGHSRWSRTSAWFNCIQQSGTPLSLRLTKWGWTDGLNHLSLILYTQ